MNLITNNSNLTTEFQEKTNPEIQNEQSAKNDSTPNTKFGADYFSALPSLFQHITLPFYSEDERLIVLLSSLTVLSSVLPEVYGNYDRKKLYTNLYLYILGKASSGKGNAIWSKLLLKPLQEQFNDMEDLIKKLSKTKVDFSKLLDSKELTQQQKLVIPANNSAAGFVELLSNNGGKGLMFETEGDTVANTLKSDYGNYSDMLRKAFHHETISQYRKGDGKLIEFESPKLSVLITSTPNQLYHLIPDPENGLFSRFMFYQTTPVEHFIDVFSDDENVDLDAIFRQAGEQFLDIHNQINEQNGVKFAFSTEQKQQFQTFFNYAKSTLTQFIDQDLDASVNRMGVIFFRVAMIFSVIRHTESGELAGSIVCSNTDFDNTKKLIEHLLSVLSKVFQDFPNKEINSLPTSKINLFKALPETFTTNEAVKLGNEYGVKERTLKNFLKMPCFEKIKHGEYKKVVK